MAYANQLTKKSDNLSEWYNKIVLEAELADYGLAKGTMIFRPYGFAIWELIRSFLEPEFKKKGVENAYFPMFIPENLLNREKEHIAGFSPELAVVTIGGGQELEEKLVVRPTSETIMYDTFAKWIHSWRDLPLQLNQWNNVVRWEKRTYLFLRTTEFLWQEGHTAHATHTEAQETQSWAMGVYNQLFREVLALPGYIGQKSEEEKFAGADMTLTLETLMPEGKALQSCTSHDLGQNFAKSFQVNFQDKDGQQKPVWQTSWGLSTRVIGGLIMAHGDDKGLRLPPQIAPIQVIILPVQAEPEILNAAEKIQAELLAAGCRVKLDNRDDESLGRRLNKWELKGVPLRLEIGRKELAENQVKLVRRDTGEVAMVALENIASEVKELLRAIQANLFKEAEEFLTQNTFSATNYAELKEIMASTRGFIKAYWCGNPDCETKIKDETKASTRCAADLQAEPGQCVYCGKATSAQWYFAQSY